MYHRIAWLPAQACCQTLGETCHGTRLYPLHCNVTRGKKKERKKDVPSHVVFGVTYFFRTAIASTLQKPWPRCPAAHVVGSFTEAYRQDVTLLCIVTEARHEYSHVHVATGTYMSTGLSVQCKFLCEVFAQVHTSELYLQFSWFHCRQCIVHETACCFHLLPPFSKRGRTIEASLSLLCHCAFRGSR